MRLSLPLWPVVAARGEEEGASSGAALEVALFRALFGQASSWQSGSCSTVPSVYACLLPPVAVVGVRWQASLLRRRWWSCTLCILCLASLGLEAPLIEHNLDGRSKPFCIQGHLRTYPQAGHKLRQSNLLGEALSEIGYRIQRQIEGKWFRPPRSSLTAAAQISGSTMVTEEDLNSLLDLLERSFLQLSEIYVLFFFLWGLL
jgi:hypothetical protein